MIDINSKLDTLNSIFKELFAELPKIQQDKEFIAGAYADTEKNLKDLNEKIDEISNQKEGLKQSRNEIIAEIVELDTKKAEMSRIDIGITERLKTLSNLSDREIAISGLEKDLDARKLDLDAKEKDLVERENQLKTEIDLDRIRKDTLMQKEKALTDKEARFSKVIANYTS